MPSLRFLLAVALVIKGASSLQAQCLAPGQPIEMQAIAPVVVAAPSPPVRAEELLPPPMRVAQPPIAPAAAPAPAPVYVEAAPAAEACPCGAGQTPLSKVRILQKWITGDEEENGGVHSERCNPWEWHPWRNPPPPPRVGCRWTRDLAVAGPLEGDHPTEAFPTLVGACPAQIEPIGAPRDLRFEMPPFPPTCVGGPKPLAPDNVYAVSRKIDLFEEPRFGPEFDERRNGRFEWRIPADRFENPFFGPRTIALDVTDTSAPGIAYRWAASDWRWDWIDGGVTILFRQPQPGPCDLYFVMRIAEPGTRTARLDDAVPLRLQFNAYANAWKLVDSALSPEFFEWPDIFFGPGADAPTDFEKAERRLQLDRLPGRHLIHPNASADTRTPATQMRYLFRFEITPNLRYPNDLVW